MSSLPHIEIVDASDWRRYYQITRPITYIGSDAASNDLVLDATRGSGVDSTHAQVIAAGQTYQLVNLGQRVILVGPNGEKALKENETTPLINGTTLTIGDFQLIFQAGEGNFSRTLDSSGMETQNSDHIHVAMQIPRTTLEAGQQVEGALEIHNAGDHSGVKFHIDLEMDGMDKSCIDINSGPILAAGAKRQVIFHLYHRGNAPRAGLYHLVFRVTAQPGYHAEEAVAHLPIEILPNRTHQLKLVLKPQPKAVADLSPALPDKSETAEEMPTSPATRAIMKPDPPIEEPPLSSEAYWADPEPDPMPVARPTVVDPGQPVDAPQLEPDTQNADQRPETAPDEQPIQPTPKPSLPAEPIIASASALADGQPDGWSAKEAASKEIASHTTVKQDTQDTNEVPTKSKTESGPEAPIADRELTPEPSLTPQDNGLIQPTPQKRAAAQSERQPAKSVEPVPQRPAPPPPRPAPPPEMTRITPQGQPTDWWEQVEQVEPVEAPKPAVLKINGPGVSTQADEDEAADKAGNNWWADD